MKQQCYHRNVNVQLIAYAQPTLPQRSSLWPLHKHELSLPAVPKTMAW